jgi:hypothetical protein
LTAAAIDLLLGEVKLRTGLSDLLGNRRAAFQVSRIIWAASENREDNAIGIDKGPSGA